MDSSLVKKYILSTFTIFLITLCLEVFVFNYSSWRSMGSEQITVATDESTDDEYLFISEPYELNDDLKNVYVDLEVENNDLAYVSVMLTDEGDKYPYSTAEYVVCDKVPRSGYSNVYPFGKAKTVQVKVRTLEGCPASIHKIVLNARKPIDFKGVRALMVFLTLLFGYLIFTQSFIHSIPFDVKKKWQYPVTILVMILIIILGKKISTADKLLLNTPWPHHLQYQELARSLEKGTVVLTEREVHPGLLSSENPYDTISLQMEGVTYSMDYAFYKGNYYAYFGIVPEVLLFYPYHMLTGGNLPNQFACFAMYVLLVIGVFILVAELIRWLSKEVPYIFYLLLCASLCLCANTVYLVIRPDVYNIPIISGTAFSFLGLGLWLLSLNTDKTVVRRLALFAGSLSMALVVGCRPQMAIWSLAAVILFMWKRDGKERELFSKKTLMETICFVVPYALVAVLVCWYNFARFGNIFDFGAAYSLTSNDMTHRGFNFDRLLRSLFCFLLQPPVVGTDYPFLDIAKIEGSHMGKFLYEYTYGGMLVSNAFVFSLWILLFKGFGKTSKKLREMIFLFVVSGLIIAGFDANAAGVIYRYTCDFAPAVMLAALSCWITYLDQSDSNTSYRLISRIAYVCMILAFAYSLLTALAPGISVCIKNDSPVLFYGIADYFNF